MYVLIRRLFLISMLIFSTNSFAYKDNLPLFCVEFDVSGCPDGQVETANGGCQPEEKYCDSEEAKSIIESERNSCISPDVFDFSCDDSTKAIDTTCKTPSDECGVDGNPDCVTPPDPDTGGGGDPDTGGGGNPDTGGGGNPDTGGGDIDLSGVISAIQKLDSSNTVDLSALNKINTDGFSLLSSTFRDVATDNTKILDSTISKLNADNNTQFAGLDATTREFLGLVNKTNKDGLEKLNSTTNKGLNNLKLSNDDGLTGLSGDLGLLNTTTKDGLSLLERTAFDGLSAINDNNTIGFGELGNSIETGFTGLGDSFDTGFAALGDELSGVADGLTNLSKTIDLTKDDSYIKIPKHDNALDGDDFESLRRSVKDSKILLSKTINDGYLDLKNSFHVDIQSSGQGGNLGFSINVAGQSFTVSNPLDNWSKHYNAIGMVIMLIASMSALVIVCSKN